jgi:uncharacterized protein YkwD
MRRAALVGIAVIGIATWGGCAIIEGFLPSAPASEPAEPPDTQVQELARLVNLHRETVQCPPLVWNEDLAAVAADHSADMLDRGYFGHQSPDGEGVDGRLENAGLRWHRAVGENLAHTPRGAAEVIHLWATSPAHRANLENCSFQVHGVGRSGDLWTQVLAGGVERR